MTAHAGLVVHLVRTGIANSASIVAMFDRLGASVADVRDGADVRRARALVLPGVGAFGAGMAMLQERGLVEPLRARVEEGRPTLCVCIGMQVLCESSEEASGVAGLRLIPARLERFAGPVRVPQMGWNRVRASDRSTVVRDGAAYFANSYRIDAVQRPAMEAAGWACASAEYAGAFVCAAERRGVLACQFHPELSGAWGRSLIERWLGSASCERTGVGFAQSTRTPGGSLC